MSNTLVVNLFGVPGAGKSTGAAHIFSCIKMAGVNAELITEYAKDKVWERTIRAVPAQFTRLKAIKILISPPPMVYMTTMANKRDGKASITSARRMIIKSVLPP